MKLSKILLVSTSLSILPAIIFAADKKDDLFGEASVAPSAAATTPVAVTNTVPSEQPKIDINGLSQEVAKLFNENSIPQTINFIRVPRIDVGHDKTQRDSWVAQYDPTRAAFESLWADISKQHGVALKDTEEFYRKSEDPSDRAAVKIILANMDLNKSDAPGTPESIKLMEVLSKFLFDQVAKYDAAVLINDEDQKGIRVRSIKAHAQGMFLSLLAVHGVIRNLTEELNKLWKAQELNEFQKRSARDAQGKALDDWNEKIKNQNLKISQIQENIESTKKSILESLRAPNVPWMAPSITLQQALDGDKSGITDREKSVETLYNPSIKVSDFETVFSWFKSQINPVGEKAVFDQRAYERRGRILEIAFGKKDSTSFEDFAGVGEKRKLALEAAQEAEAKAKAEKEAAEAKAKAEAEAGAKKEAEAKPAQSGGWFSWWSSSTPEQKADNSATPAISDAAATSSSEQAPQVSPAQKSDEPKVEESVKVVQEAPKPAVSEIPTEAKAEKAEVTSQTKVASVDTKKTQDVAENPAVPKSVAKATVQVSTKLSSDGVTFSTDLKANQKQQLIERATAYLQDRKLPAKAQPVAIVSLFELYSQQLVKVQKAFENNTVSNADEANQFVSKLTDAKEAIEAEAKKRGVDLSKKK